jgi:hypothetical protein
LAEEEYKHFANVYAADTLAWCLYRNGKYPEAHTMIGKALALRTPDAQILYDAGMIDAKLGNRRVAQKRLYEALSLNPGFNPIGAKEAVATLKDLGSQPAL